MSRIISSIQRDPEVFLLAQGFCWRPRVPRPTNHYFLEDVWLFDLGTPGLQKTLGHKTTSGSGLQCLINQFRLLRFLFWFVLGRAGLREAP